MVDEGSVQSPDDWHPIASPVTPLLSSRLDDAAARSLTLSRQAFSSGPGRLISAFVLLALALASLQNLPDFLSAPASLLEDSRHEAAAALALIARVPGSLDANDPSSSRLPLNSHLSPLRLRPDANSNRSSQATITLLNRLNNGLPGDDGATAALIPTPAVTAEPQGPGRRRAWVRARDRDS